MALVTTTINVPRVLELYRRHDARTQFIIAGDQKSPHDAITAFMEAVQPCWYLAPDIQENWKCSKYLGWNTIQRRNIATLRALRAGAEIIITVDDDNIPMGRLSFFDQYAAIFGGDFNGLRLTHPNHTFTSRPWIDHGQLLLPPVTHRGFPRTREHALHVKHVAGAKVAVATGPIIGDPDIDAVTRIASAPHVHGVHELLRQGVTIDPDCYTVFNSQNTAFLRQFAPCMFMVPGVGRYDDIIASLITQRVMRETGHCVHVGKPFVYQQRNRHDLTTDLAAEMEYYGQMASLGNRLDDIDIEGMTVVDQVRTIYEQLDRFLPRQAVDAAEAWCADCEEAMK